jgi:hypothetical protein
MQVHMVCALQCVLYLVWIYSCEYHTSPATGKIEMHLLDIVHKKNRFISSFPFRSF